MSADNIPPAGPITNNVDLHLTKANGVFAVEMLSMVREDDGQETTLDSLGEIRIAADDCVPEGYDAWFSFRDYMAYRYDHPFSARLHRMLEMAGVLGLAEVDR